MSKDTFTREEVEAWAQELENKAVSWTDLALKTIQFELDKDSVLFDPNCGRAVLDRASAAKEAAWLIRDKLKGAKGNGEG